MKNELKYKVSQNNYVGLLFFALVLAASLYIIKHETKDFRELEPSQNAILTNEKVPEEILVETEQIANLRKYLNLGDAKTFKVYQSMYVWEDDVSVDDMNVETLLYLAYKYIMKTTDVSRGLSYITCDEAGLIELDDDIIQCGGSRVNASYFTVNHLITKESLKNTVRKLYNINIDDFRNFYTSLDNLCYYVNDEYLCVSKTNNTSVSSANSEFIKAVKYDNKITIIEKYRYIVDGIYYKGFISDEIGEGLYISTFEKINGSYYWVRTENYKED